MARPLRLQFPGAVHHVLARGHERSRIFADDEDRKRWLDLLAMIVPRERWVVHAYCLMGNHYHLLIETPDGGISTGVHALNSRYAQWFNRRRRESGHLFEGRFRGILVQRGSHALKLARYIVLNPVRAKAVGSPGQWRWSSYRATAGLAAAPSWLEIDWTLGQFASPRPVARAAYRRFVAEGKGVESPAGVRGQIYLGDARFLKDLHQLAQRHREDPRIPLSRKRPEGPTVEEIAAAVGAEWNIEPSSLSRRRLGDAKVAAIYLARALTRMKVLEIGQQFGVRSARVSNAVRQVRESESTPLRNRIARVENLLRAK